MSDTDRSAGLSRRRALAIIGTVGAASAGAAIGINSFFSGADRVDPAELVAGGLDLQVDWQETYNGDPVAAFPDENDDGVLDAIATREELARDEYGESFEDLADSRRETIEDRFASQFADRGEGPAPTVDLGDVEPGDEGRVTFSLHLFEEPGWIQLLGDAGDAEATPGEGAPSTELGRAIQATVWYDENGDGDVNRYDAGDGMRDEAVLAQGPLSHVLARLRTGLTLDGDRQEPNRQPFDRATTHHLGFRWELPEDSELDGRPDSMGFSLGFYTEAYTDHGMGPSPEPFAADLPSIPTIDATTAGAEVRLTMDEATHSFHEDFPETTVWGYNAPALSAPKGYLGPTIEAWRNREITVEYRNDLPADHLLPVDKTVHGAGPFEDPAPEVRAVPHLHGGNVPNVFDGYPETWTTPDGQRNPDPAVPYPADGSGDTIRYRYPNTQPAAQLWYHDHAIGITRLNVYAGLASLYTIRDDTEAGLLEGNVADGEPALPSGDYEVPLVLQDKSFAADGSLHYPDGLPVGGEDFPESAAASVVPSFLGDTAVVNGTVWPSLEVEPRKYRFRLVNGCNSRFLDLKLVEWDEDSHTFDVDAPGPAFTLVGTGGGLVERPVEVEDRLLLNPANRYDVVVDFSGHEGQDFLLHNDDRGPPRTMTQAGGRAPLPEFVVFRVADTTPTEPDQPLPDSLATVPDLGPPDEERYFTLEAGEDEFGRRMLLLNDLEVAGSAEPGDAERWTDPASTTVTEGETQVWHFINLTDVFHPIHLHLIQFQIVGRKAFDASRFVSDGRPLGDLEEYVGEDRPLTAYQGGWHDTVAVRPHEVTQVKATWGEFPTDDGTIFADHVDPDSEGDLYPWHCHVLEHEDHEMMLPYVVHPRS